MEHHDKTVSNIAFVINFHNLLLNWILEAKLEEAEA
jgi:hypothetical protein